MSIDFGGLFGGLLGYAAQKETNNYNLQAVQETNEMNRYLKNEEIAAYNRQMDLQQQQFLASQEYQDKAWQRSVEYNDLMYQRELEDNSPLAQRDRLLAAGINPYQVLGGSSPVQAQYGNPSPTSSPSPGSMPSIPQAASMHAFQKQNEFEPAITAYLNARKINAEARISDEQAYQMSIENEFKRTQLEVDLSKRIQEIINLRNEENTPFYLRRKLEKEYEILNEELIFLRETKDQRKDNIGSQNFVNYATGGKLHQEMRRLEIQANLDQIFAKDERLSQLASNKAQTYYANSMAADALSHIDVNKENANVLSANVAKTWLEAYGLTPGSPMYNANYQLLRRQIKQAIQDYWNPFNLLGKALGGSAGVTKVVK